jgi:hypothetical protein
MARLTYKARKAMPKKSFALPSKREGGKGGYPIPDKSHARNALSRVSQKSAGNQNMLGHHHTAESKSQMSINSRGRETPKSDLFSASGCTKRKLRSFISRGG